ncbi:MAG: hypothetical protein ACRDD8_14690 [Bacteroidales bacterium]
MAGKGRIWNTRDVEENIQRMRMGQDFDNGPFFANDPELRAADLNFDWTNEELAEYVRCSQDCVYFVQKYCKFLTDRGRVTVNLRDYQKRILSLLTLEEYKPNVRELGPVHRNVALCQSRQSGKCCTPTTTVETASGKKVPFYKLSQSKRKSVIGGIKQLLYRFYNYL